LSSFLSFLSQVLDKIEFEVYNNIVPPGGQIVPPTPSIHYEKTTRKTRNLMLILFVFSNNHSNSLVVKNPPKS